MPPRPNLILATRNAHKTEEIRHILGDRFEVDFHLQVAETATVAEGHAIAGRIKADILKSHPEVVSVLVHVEPDAPEHRKQDGHHGFNA